MKYYPLYLSVAHLSILEEVVSDGLSYLHEDEGLLMEAIEVLGDARHHAEASEA